MFAGSSPKRGICVEQVSEQEVRAKSCKRQQDIQRLYQELLRYLLVALAECCIERHICVGGSDLRRGNAFVVLFHRLVLSISLSTTLDEVMSSIEGYLLNDKGAYFHHYSRARMYGTRNVMLCGKKDPMCLHGASGEVVLQKQPEIDLTTWEATCSWPAFFLRGGLA